MSALEELKRMARAAADTECVDWPRGARLQALPVGARVIYGLAHYERTAIGLRCYWTDSASAVLGRDYAIEGGRWLEPDMAALPPGYRFSGSEVVKEGAPIASCSLAGVLGEAYAQGIQGQAGDCPRPECARRSWNPMRDRCDHCGVTGKEIAAKRAKPACKCGATENLKQIGVMFPHGVACGEFRCGPCEQSRRRTELQAAKLDQTKRAMDRPVKRDPYEWPAGFSSPSWEE
jgi:hypothetical protein